MRTFLIPLSVALLASCGGGSNSGDSGDPVPSDVPSLVRQGYLRYPAPPAGYTVVVPWLTAIHDERSSEPSRIDVDYLRAYCRNSTGDHLLSSYEYGDRRVEGGLWQRRPNWFASGYIGPLPSTFDLSAGTVSFSPSSNGPAAWHLWGPRGSIAQVAPGASKCWVEARVRVSGPALIQGGADYYTNMTSTSPLEAGVTSWLFAAQTWQEIIFAR